jgi:hypothetical protein
MSRKTAANTTLIYTKIVERYAQFFERPETRLRFLNNTLARQTLLQQQLCHSLRRFAFIQHTRLYQWLLEMRLYCLIFEELKRLRPTLSEQHQQSLQQIKVPFQVQLVSLCYQLRYAFYGVGIALAGVALIGLYLTVTWSMEHLNEYLARRYQPPPQLASPLGQHTAIAGTRIDFLPDYSPEKVWLVEKKDNYEYYSNGGQILTDYTTDNRPRAYYLLLRGAERAENRLSDKIVGIVYHTSENHMVPFTAANNHSIKTRTQYLLEYVRENKSYNYVIDRVGKIYRIVRDEHAANHAGHSIWADQRHVYIGLNDSFLGVCFESSSRSLGEPLTEAQLIAGRALTAILRSRYHIDDANCVTHGLVSVNPSNMMIAYHYDWVRNFPFQAMGLSDKYQVAPASISEFGFTYDEETLHKLGGTTWPGVAIAEEEFKSRAARANLSPEELRRRLRDRYRQHYELTRKLRQETPPAPEQAQVTSETALARRAPESGANGK